MICLGNHRVNFRSKEAMYFKITGDFYDPLEVAYKKGELESELSAVPLKKGFYLREPNTGFVWTSVGEHAFFLEMKFLKSI